MLGYTEVMQDFYSEQWLRWGLAVMGHKVNAELSLQGLTPGLNQSMNLLHPSNSTGTVFVPTTAR